MQINFDDFLKIEIYTGTIIEVNDFQRLKSLRISY